MTNELMKALQQMFLRNRFKFARIAHDALLNEVIDVTFSTIVSMSKNRENMSPECIKAKVFEKISTKLKERDAVDNRGESDAAGEGEEDDDEGG